MRNLIVILILFLNAVQLYSQEPVYPKDETCRFSFFEGKIADTNKLNLKIRYFNTEKDTILMPIKLIDGIKYDPFGNFYLEMEKFSGGKYERFVDMHIDYFYGDSNPEPKRAYIKLKPGDSGELNFNLISRIGAFYKGKYKMRVHLLKTPINDPPKCPMEYVTSRWFYFQVVKDMNYHDIY